MAHSIVSPIIIGREREIDRLDTAIQAAANGEGRLILISGEAGIGKSRLVVETVQRFGLGWMVLRGQCYEQESGFPFSPWIDPLRTLMKQAVIDDGNSLPRVWIGALAHLLPELQSSLTASPSPTTNQELDKQLLSTAVSGAILRLSTAHPVLIEIEDIHWSDEPSLDLLRFVVRHTLDSPIFILATYRSDEIRPQLAAFLAEMEREPRAEEIGIAPLTEHEVDQLVHSLVHLPPGSPITWLDTLLAWTEGNAFYIEEMLQALVNAGIDFASVEKQALQNQTRLHIPRSIQETVRRRADELNPEARGLLTLASVMGQQFEGRLLEALSQMESQIFLTQLKCLMDAHLIFESEPDIFSFRHALTRESVYTSLLGREKQALHRRIGKGLEGLFGASTHHDQAELAYHFYEAASWPEAFHYARLAGEQAQAFYAPREAALQYNRALEAAQHLGINPPVDCLIGRANAYELLGDFDRARKDLESALVVVQSPSADESQKPTLECRLLIRLGFLWLSRDFRRAGEYFPRALQLAQQQNDPALLASTLNRVGNWRLNQNQPFQAREYHEQALAIFEKLGDTRGIAETLDLLGVTHYLCGNMLQGQASFIRAIQIWERLDARANLVQSLVHIDFPAVVDTEIEHPIEPVMILEHCEKALSLASEMGWLSAMAEACVNFGSLKMVGEYDRSLEEALKGLAIAREIGHRYSLTLVYSYLGGYYLDLFALDQAREALEQSIDLARASGAEILKLRSTVLLAMVAIKTGEMVDAENLLAEAITDEKVQQTVFVRFGWGIRAELILAQGHPEEALEIVEWLIESAENGPARGEKGVPFLSWVRGKALAGLSRWTEAEEELKAAEVLARRYYRIPLLWQVQVSLGKLYLKQGHREQAHEVFEQAREVIHRLAARVPGALRDPFRERAESLIPDLGQTRTSQTHPGGLTMRELEVAALIAQGKTNREIAENLVVGVRTIEAHITRILTKLNFKSRTEVALWAAGNGLVNRH